jgi:hypothetical protein
MKYHYYFGNYIIKIYSMKSYIDKKKYIILDSFMIKMREKNINYSFLEGS